MDKITIHKMGEEAKVEIKKKPLKSILKKTSKIKLRGVRDPSSTRKHTIRLLTSKGHRKHDKTLKKKIGGLSDQKVSEITKNAGLVKNTNMPPEIQRQILSAAVSSGFVSNSNIN